MRYIIIFFSFIITFISCEPANIKMTIKNKTNSDVVCRFVFENEDIDSLSNLDRSKLIYIKGYKTEKLAIFQNLLGIPNGWKAIYNTRPNTLMMLVVVPQKDLNIIKLDTLKDDLYYWNLLYKINKNKYIYRKYSFEDLENIDFQILLN